MTGKEQRYIMWNCGSCRHDQEMESKRGSGEPNGSIFLIERGIGICVDMKRLRNRKKDESFTFVSVTKKQIPIRFRGSNKILPVVLK